MQHSGTFNSKTAVLENASDFKCTLRVCHIIRVAAIVIVAAMVRVIVLCMVVVLAEATELVTSIHRAINTAKGCPAKRDYWTSGNELIRILGLTSDGFKNHGFKSQSVDMLRTGLTTCKNNRSKQGQASCAGLPERRTRRGTNCQAPCRTMRFETPYFEALRRCSKVCSILCCFCTPLRHPERNVSALRGVLRFVANQKQPDTRTHARAPLNERRGGHLDVAVDHLQTDLDLVAEC